ncbi:hypothetical protein BH23GEM6_BH23GEM6_26700 [soil metagenome]
MANFKDLAREYEARRFPVRRRLDLQAEGPETARDRALRWIQSFAHEEPGEELLLIVDRGSRPGRPPGPIRRSVEKLLRELEGGLISWWQPFGDGSLALRLSDEPRLALRRSESTVSEGEGRTPETAGIAVLALHHDIPDDLLNVASRIAELRRAREGLSVGLLEVVLRRIWIEAQAQAMTQRIEFDRALEEMLAAERARSYEGL